MCTNVLVWLVASCRLKHNPNLFMGFKTCKTPRPTHYYKQRTANGLCLLLKEAVLKKATSSLMKISISVYSSCASVTEGFSSAWLRSQRPFTTESAQLSDNCLNQIFFWRGAGGGEREGSHCSWKKLLEFKFGLKRCVNLPSLPREERGELVGPGRTERMGSCWGGGWETHTVVVFWSYCQ